MKKTILTSFIFVTYTKLVLAWKPNGFPFIPACNDVTKVRELIIQAQGKGKRILDIGCGNGFSTSSYEGSLGIDINEKNIFEAKQMFPYKNFSLLSMNDEKHKEEFEVVTSMFYLSTVPQYIRTKLLNYACETAKERVVILDVSPEYITDNKLLTERKIYNPDFMQTFRDDLSHFNENVLVDGLLNVWIYNIPKTKDPTRKQIKPSFDTDFKRNYGKNSCDLSI